MRIRLYREGFDTNDGRRLLNTTWRRPPLPVLLASGGEHYPSTTVGTVTALQKESDLWVTGHLTHDPDIDPTGLHAEADFTHVNDPVLDGEVLVIIDAELASVTLGTRPTWEGMQIK